MGQISRSVLLALLAFTIIFTGCFGQPRQEPGVVELEEYDNTFFVMDTFVTIQFFADSLDKAEVVLSDVQWEMTRLEGILSSHLPDSDIANIEQGAGIAPVPVSGETLAILETAWEFAEKTQGAFDVTIAPILRLYNFASGKESRPSRQQLEINLPLVDWRGVQIDSQRGTVYLTKENMKIDLGGTAKGYIIDRVVEIMVGHGVEFGLVNAGGDIRLLGPKRDGTPWRVGLKNPDNPGGKYFAVIEVAGGAIVTSGDYERYFIEDGVRYHHIIDPKSGLPADGVRSVTVIAEDAQLADLLSTAIFVLGPAGLDFANNLAGVEAIIWTRTGEVLWSSGLVNVANPGTEFLFRSIDNE